MENQWKNQWKNHHICRTPMEKLKNHGKNGKSYGKPLEKLENQWKFEWNLNGRSMEHPPYL